MRLGPDSGLSLFEQLGGEDVLREVVRDFYRRIFDDVMIGFFFRGLDRDHLIERELEFASQVLGGPLTYQGRSMRETHQRHPILSGHFDRRQQILRQSLQDSGIPPSAAEAWIQAGERMRDQIILKPGS